MELGLKDLVGTSMLRASMHGYYISNAVYHKAKQLTNPVKPQNVYNKKLKETIAEKNTTSVVKRDEVRKCCLNLLTFDC